MKNITCCIAVSFLSYLSFSCQSDEVKVPEFNVATADLVVAAGEPVTFDFIGNPDFITFFSGENGKKYENVNRSTAEGKPILQFTSLRANGSQDGSLQVMVSNDFQGILPGNQPTTIKRISDATWLDITSRVQLSEGASKHSGEIDLSDFGALEKPVYIGFKYTGKSGSIQNKWTISGLSIVNKLPDESVYTLANLTSGVIANYGIANIFSPGWVAQRITNEYNWVVASSSLTVTGATATASEDAEAWVMSGPVQLREVTPDVGIFVKGMDIKTEDFSYIYTSPGTYSATFVGASTNIYGSKEIIRTVNVNVQ